MVLELLTITFTNQDDIVPLSGAQEIVNTGIVHTFAGNDIITGTATPGSSEQGFSNIGTLNTNEGNDIITGIGAGDFYGIFHSGYIDTGDGNDVIAGINPTGGTTGIFSYVGAINTGNGDDIITGIAETFGILNGSTIDTGNGNDSIISQGNIQTVGRVFLGNGNDSILVDYGHQGSLVNSPNSGIEGGGIIDTGDGNDIISTREGIFNDGVINTGSGNDSIISGVSGFINIGIINTGDGNDSIIGDQGFNLLPFYSRGSVFLGNGEDHIRTFGSNDFYGGKGNDILELTSGSYIIEISGTAVNFIKDSTIMKTSEFERLIAGNTTYNFSSLTNGQTIFVT